VEIGTPAKGGSVKIYFDATDTKETNNKLLSEAFRMRDEAHKLWVEQQGLL